MHGNTIVFGTAKTLLAKPGIEASGFIRVGELIAKELGIGFNDIRDDDQWLAFMIRHPTLIERTIAAVNNKAVIARRLEQVIELGRQSVGPCYDAWVSYRTELIRGFSYLETGGHVCGIVSLTYCSDPLKERTMNMHISLAPILALLAGILILVQPKLLNYVVAIYLIIIGLLGLFGGSLNL